MIRHFWLSPFLLKHSHFLNKKAKIKTDSAVSAGSQGKPFASAWSSTVDLNVLFLIDTRKETFLIYMLLMIRLSPIEITQHQALLNTIFNAY